MQWQPIFWVQPGISKGCDTGQSLSLVPSYSWDFSSLPKIQTLYTSYASVLIKCSAKKSTQGCFKVSQSPWKTPVHLNRFWIRTVIDRVCKTAVTPVFKTNMFLSGRGVQLLSSTCCFHCYFLSSIRKKMVAGPGLFSASWNTVSRHLCTWRRQYVHLSPCNRCVHLLARSLDGCNLVAAHH